VLDAERLLATDGLNSGVRQIACRHNLQIAYLTNLLQGFLFKLIGQGVL